MAALSVRVTLKQPLLISHLGTGDENSANALSYIPGSVLRGAIIQRYASRHGEIDLGREANGLAQQLFFSDSVRYLNSYPEATNGKRMLPRPLSWRIEKGTEKNTGTYYDYALDDAGLSQPKPPSGLYWAYVGTEESPPVALFTVRRQIGMHNASERRFLKTSDNSTVFRYDSLAAGQTFVGAVLSDDETLLRDHIAPLLEPGDFYIGRSRNAGYGRIQLEWTMEKESWGEYAEGRPPADSEQKFTTMTLLSHAVLRDGYGGYTTNLAAALGSEFEPKGAFVKTEVIGGFNRTWGMPYLQQPVLCAGSVFVFDRSMKATLSQLVHTGIGERRNEGFGRVAIDLFRRPMLSVGEPVSKPVRTEAIALSGPDRMLAQRMAERIYREVLDQKLLALLNTASMNIQHPPENNQLSRLRLVARRAWVEESPQQMIEHLDNLASTARDQYRQARIGRQSLHDWLRSGWQDHRLWSDNFHIPIAQLPRVGDVRAEATDALKVEYMARLVDGLCNKSVKYSSMEARQ